MNLICAAVILGTALLLGLLAIAEAIRHGLKLEYHVKNSFEFIPRKDTVKEDSSHV